MFLPFCFYVGFIFGDCLALFFLSCFLFCFQSMKRNTAFPAILVSFEVKLVKKVVCFLC